MTTIPGKADVELFVTLSDDEESVTLTVNSLDGRVTVDTVELLEALGYNDVTVTVEESDEVSPEKPRYAEGDRVVIQPDPQFPNDGPNRYAAAVVGEVGTVASSDYTGGWWVKVGHRHLLLRPDSIAPYTEPEALADWERDLLGLDEPTIEVGGVYRVKDDPHFTAGGTLRPCARAGSRTPGAVARVVGTFADGDFRVSRDDTPGGPIHPDYLEPVGEPRVGDRVRITSGWDAITGATGVVTETVGDWDYPFHVRFDKAPDATPWLEDTYVDLGEVEVIP